MDVSRETSGINEFVLVFVFAFGYIRERIGGREERQVDKQKERERERERDWEEGGGGFYDQSVNDQAMYTITCRQLIILVCCVCSQTSD